MRFRVRKESDGRVVRVDANRLGLKDNVDGEEQEEEEEGGGAAGELQAAEGGAVVSPPPPRSWLRASLQMSPNWLRFLSERRASRLARGEGDVWAARGKQGGEEEGQQQHCE